MKKTSTPCVINQSIMDEFAAVGEVEMSTPLEPRPETLRILRQYARIQSSEMICSKRALLIN